MRTPDHGALVISLDFELHWGVRERVRPGHPYWTNLEGARGAVERMLDVFGEHGVGATWATVGFLFARSREEREAFAPPRRPRYGDAALDAYAEPVGASEVEDPLHYAPSLVERIQRTPRQELATHTFSHYYCLEPGQTVADFEADTAAAVAIARARGATFTSIVFPRNQWEPSYAPVLLKNGIRAFRGNERSWLNAPSADDRERILRRALRLADAHSTLRPAPTVLWADVPCADGLFDVRASHFVRPWSPRAARWHALHRRRLLATMRAAARQRSIAHLWWHPHNFGRHTEENIVFLRALLEEAERLRASHGLRVMTMAEVVEVLRDA